MHSNLFAPPRSKSLCLLCFLPHAVPRSACVHILLRILEVFLSSVIAPVSSSRSRDIVSLCARFSSPAHKRQTVDNLFSSFLVLLLTIGDFLVLLLTIRRGDITSQHLCFCVQSAARCFEDAVQDVCWDWRMQKNVLEGAGPIIKGLHPAVHLCQLF